MNSLFLVHLARRSMATALIGAVLIGCGSASVEKSARVAGVGRVESREHFKAQSAAQPNASLPQKLDRVSCSHVLPIPMPLVSVGPDQVGQGQVHDFPRLFEGVSGDVRSGKPTAADFQEADSQEIVSRPIAALVSEPLLAGQPQRALVSLFRTLSDVAESQQISRACLRLPALVAIDVSDRWIAFQHSGSLVVAIYDRATGQLIAATSKIQSRAASMRFSPAENSSESPSLLVGASDGIVYRWFWHPDAEIRRDIKGREWQVERYVGHAAAVQQVAWHPGGNTFFSADRAGSLFAWQVYERDQYGGARDRSRSESDVFTDTAVRTAFNRSLTPLVVTPDVAVGNARAVVRDIAVDPSGTLLLAADEDGSVELWRVQGLELLSRRSLVKGDRGPAERSRPRAVSWSSSQVGWVLDHLGRLARIAIKPETDRLGIRPAFGMQIQQWPGSFSALGARFGLTQKQELLVLR